MAFCNGCDPGTGEVGDTCNQRTCRLPVVDTARQCETLCQMMTDSPTGKDTNIATASDCIKRSCGISCRNVITINGGNEMGWQSDSVEGGVGWQDEAIVATKYMM